MELSKIFHQFPLFHKWVEEKKLSEKDLTILTEFKNLSPIIPLLKWLAAQRPSHSDGRQILDLAGELLLMGENLPLPLKVQKPSMLREQLRKIRFRESTSQEKEKSQIVQGLNWPSSIKAKWIRQGDRGALSVYFHSFSLQDFQQKIQKLEDIYQKLDKSKKLWKE